MDEVLRAENEKLMEDRHEMQQNIKQLEQKLGTLDSLPTGTDDTHTAVNTDTQPPPPDDDVTSLPGTGAK